jgi:CheY-like chemotaxis protein
VLRQALENAGHRVSVAGNGVAGLEQVQQQDEVDLVICDLFMPTKDGFDTLRELRALRPDLPVIIMSGRFQSGPRAAAEQVDYLHIASELGASGTLQKPFRLPDLVDMVAGILAGNRGKL